MSQLAIGYTRNTQANALRALYAVNFFAYGSFFPYLIPYLQEQITLSGFQSGLLLALSPLMIILVQPFWGMLCDRTGKPKSAMLLALAGSLISAAVLTGADTFPAIVVTFGALAVFQCGILPIADSLTMSFSIRSGIAYGSFGLWGAVGFSSSVLLTGILAEHFPLALIVWIYLSACVLGAVLLLFVPGELQERGAVQPGARRERRQPGGDLARLARIPQMAMFLAAALLIFGTVFANNFYFGTYVSDVGGTISGTGFLLLLSAGSEIPFMKYADRIARRWGMLPVMVTASALICIRWFMYGADLPQPVLYVTTLMQGYSVGLMLPLAIQFVTGYAPSEARASAIALYSAIGSGVGNTVCNFAGGILLHSHSIHVTYVFFGVLAVMGTLLLAGIGMLEARAKRG